MVDNGHINGIYCHHDMPLKDGNADAWMEALDEMDLVIAVDAYWNGVSRNADVVFADATQLEKDTSAPARGVPTANTSGSSAGRPPPSPSSTQNPTGRS